MDIYYIDRKTGERKKEVVAGDRFLRWMYNTYSGNSILQLIVKKKLFSSLYGKIQDIAFSKNKISSFVNQLNIQMDEAEIEDILKYKNFNDFFARRLKKDARPICNEAGSLVSPADGRVLAYENIKMDEIIQVKGSIYRLEELFQDTKLAQQYDGGTCVVVRLCPSDYHRFHFPDSGVSYYSKKIDGNYYSVNPIALSKIAKIYCENKREITLFNSDNFGQMVLIEVGATCVGSIIQTYEEGKKVEKGEEKGYFKFGGSTVIMFLQKDSVKIDDDIIKNTNDEIETKVDMGDRIGKIYLT
ncbi:phosphatidylserine decarboxylase [Alkaliphilus sp. MSJ-5]|uniref:Phosphatidylserine decarboxylase proenzyme n=1 Tax=Alkaliphilus flagellatus TaxID=2841507 RepID=A0ABS6FXS0_9FIRM|nr:phosphatidylserine decarboxylase [Alkaliphilus flagellatus]MBU5674883.1 phosphatidylserine decarboxylase [Alkaliphilus flagellatus]